MDLIMATLKKDKIKAIQAALLQNEVLAPVLPKLNQTQVEELEQVVADTLFALADENGKVKFADLGDFEVRETKARKAINPAKFAELKEQGVDVETAKVQASVDVAAGHKLAFSQSKKIKDELKG